MLFKLSIKNMKKSMKDYAIYFFTLILGVSIFYIFNSMETQTVFLDVSKDTRDIIKLMIMMLSGVSVFVSIVMGFLIIYANQFLMKRRKKEFGIYLTLGMSKGKISKILFIETLFIGFISLVVGLFLGVGLSQLMSVLVANMFEADLSKFSFIFSSSAMIKTIIYFGIMYLLVMVFNTITVGKCKLIDLLHASKKNEQVKMKNPILCMLVFIASAILLGIAYYNATVNAVQMSTEKLMLMIAFGGIGTFLLFWSLSGMLLRIFMSMKRMYYKNLNMFVLRQIASKVNTTVFSMTVISIMLFLTIGVLSSALSLKNSMTYNLKKLAAVDFQAMKYVNLDEGNRGVTYTEAQYEDAKLSVRDTLNRLDIPIDKTFQDVVEFNTYVIPEITFRTSIGDRIEEVTKQYKFLNVDTKETFMKISDYNRVAKQMHMETYSLKENEYMVVADFDSMISIRNKSLKEKPTLHISGKDYVSKYPECMDGFIEISANFINTGIILVPDDALKENMASKRYFSANYKANTEEEKKAMEQVINDLDNHPYVHNTALNGMTKIAIYNASVGLGAMATFIGLYLGIIFLISSAAILALKELSESSDNKERYMILRRIGTDEKMIRHALFAQIAIFFTVPLLVAILHSIFGIQFANQILITFGNQQLLASIIMTATFLIAIYGGYFLITYLCSRNIISEK